MPLSQVWRDRFADGPLDLDWWQGDIDSRLPGIFRAGLGGILLYDAVTTFPLVKTFYGTTGLWPAALGSGPLVGLSDSALLGVWTGGCFALLAFALGLFTELSAVLSWFFLVAVHHRNPGVTTGGDYLAQVLLFFCMFLRAGSAFSLDARFFGRSRPFVAAAPWRAMQCDIAILYFVTARLKIRGGWLSGDGIYLSLQHLGFLRPPGALLLGHPEFCRLSTYVVLASEGAFAFFALSPIKPKLGRTVAIGCALAVQLGILVTMRVGMFTALMLWMNALYLPVAMRPPQSAAARTRHVALHLAAMAVLTLLAWPVFAGRRWPVPRPIAHAQTALGLTQQYDLFGVTYEVEQWQARGVEADGRDVDVFDVTGSGFRSVVGWHFSPFYKITFAKNADYRAVAGWLCRSYAEKTARALSRIRLSQRVRQPLRPGETRPFDDLPLYDGDCP